MKTINVTFTDEEHEKLKKVKVNAYCYNWHDLFMKLTEQKVYK